MVGFEDGPAKGTALALQRTPLLLRVVINESGVVDALDQLDDEPDLLERVYVYERIGASVPVHIQTSPRRNSGWVRMASYRHRVDVDEDLAERLRDTAAWRLWSVNAPLHWQDPSTTSNDRLSEPGGTA